ncbi:MAG TPA: alpha/beta hydrolase-fold protein [Gaiellales bacterium]|jgi:enterochelin esterase family protein|nr:alpha/beta hydrolase-fold protein [Gaiellales bacterium]
MVTLPSARLQAPRALRVAATCLAVAVTGVGLAFFARYVNDYVLYRGFGPPHASVAPSAQGRIDTLAFHSPALGGRPMRALVYLPAAYRTQPWRHFPVAYLLHGTPGDPRTAFVNSLHVGPRLDLLILQHRMQPLIVVMPPGSPSTYARATEWANGPARDARWFTYLTHDLIHAVDRHLRTIRNRSGRGIGGYSSGADAALNAILLRPHLYSVAEGWSGDYRQTPATVGRDAALVRHFSALDTAPSRARELARTGAHVYLYAGRRDRVMRSTLRVGLDLRRAGVRTRVDFTGGGHAWALWSARLDGALRYFSTHLAGSHLAGSVAA